MPGGSRNLSAKAPTKAKRDERYAADELDIGNRQVPDQRQARAAAQRQQKTQRKCQHDSGDGDEQSEMQTTPIVQLDAIKSRKG